MPEADQRDFISVAAGLAHTCAITSGLRLVCWGCAKDGRTDVPLKSLDNSFSFSRRVNLDIDVEDLEAGARSGDGSIGLSNDHQLKLDKTDSQPDLIYHDQVQSVQVGLAHTC